MQNVMLRLKNSTTKLHVGGKACADGESLFDKEVRATKERPPDL